MAWKKLTSKALVKDKVFQEIGTTIFPGDTRLSINTNPKERKVISVRIVEPLLEARNHHHHDPRKAYVVIYPEYDFYNEHYDIYIDVTLREPHDAVLHRLLIEGHHMDVQNELMETLREKHTVEVWVSSEGGKFYSLYNPVKVEAAFADTIPHILEFNRKRMKPCKECGRLINPDTESELCDNCRGLIIAQSRYGQA